MVASSDASGIGLMVRRLRLPMAVAEFVRQEAQRRSPWDQTAAGRLNASAMGLGARGSNGRGLWRATGRVVHAG